MRAVQKWAFLFGCILVAAAVWPLFPALVITDVKASRPVMYIPVHDGEEFVISFVHSVNKRPVYDHIRVNGQSLTIVKSRYDAFGAGMPETAVDGKTLTINHDGMLELSGVNYTLPEIKLFVGTVSQHALHIQNKRILLSSLVQPGEPLQFKVMKVSYLQMWKGRCLYD